MKKAFSPRFLDVAEIGEIGTKIADRGGHLKPPFVALPFAAAQIFLRHEHMNLYTVSQAFRALASDLTREMRLNKCKGRPNHNPKHENMSLYTASQAFRALASELTREMRLNKCKGRPNHNPKTSCCI